MNTNQNKDKQPIVLSLVDGTKSIAAEFVATCKSKPLHVLRNDLKSELGNLKNSNGRASKCEKATNRINIIVNSICKKVNATDISSFEQDKTVKFVANLLQDNSLKLVALQDGNPIECVFSKEITAATTTTATAGNHTGGIW